MLNIRIHNAIVFAAQMHKNQLRKGTDLPYIIHPMEVMQILTENGCNEDLIIAGILHDVLEDTAATPDIVEKLFGSKVLSLVKSETQDTNKPWKERRQDALQKIEQEDQETQLVFCADKLSNIKSIYADKLAIGNDVFKRFSAPLSDIKWYYQNMVLALNKIDDYKMKHEFKIFVDKVFNS